MEDAGVVLGGAEGLGVGTSASPNGATGTSAAEGRRKKRRAPRASYSCQECTRRKIKCDKVVPCLPCSKRGEAKSCSMAPGVEVVPAQTMADDDLDSQRATKKVRVASLEDLTALQLSAKVLKQRLFHLESLIGEFMPREPHNEADAESDTYEEEEGYVLPAAATIAIAMRERSPERGGHLGPQPQPPPAPPAAPLIPAASTAFSSRDEGVMDVDNDVTAAVTLERLAVGWDSTEGREMRSALRRQVNTSHASLAHPIDHEESSLTLPAIPLVFPSDPSFKKAQLGALLALLPDKQQSSDIVEFSLTEVMWQAGGVVNGPQFRKEHVEFLSWENPVDVVNPAWVALLFAVLCMGLRHMTTSELERIGFREELQNQRVREYFQCSVDALHNASFMEHHTFYSLQVIALFALVLQDIGSLDLHSTFLATALRIAQQMGLSRLGSEQDWVAGLAKDGIALSSQQGRALLVARQMKARVWAGLNAEDSAWASGRHGYSTALALSNTPLPLNLHDADLWAGRNTPRPSEEPTVVSKTLLHVPLGAFLREVFDVVFPSGRPLPPSTCHEFVDRFRRLSASLPSYLSSGADVSHLAPFVPSLRRWWLMCEDHSMLVLNRSVLSAGFGDLALANHRQTATQAALSTVRLFTQRTYRGFQTIWMSSFHILEAGLLLLVDCFHAPAVNPASTGTSDLNGQEKLEAIRTVVESFRKLEGSTPWATKSRTILESLLTEVVNRAGRQNTEARNVLDSTQLDGPPTIHNESAASTSTLAAPFLQPAGSCGQVDAYHPFPTLDFTASNDLFSESGLGVFDMHGFEDNYLSNMHFDSWGTLEDLLKGDR